MSKNKFPELPYFLDPAKQNPTEDRELEAAMRVILDRLEKRFGDRKPEEYFGRQIMNTAEQIRKLAEPANQHDEHRMSNIQLLAVSLSLVGGSVIEMEGSGQTAGYLLSLNQEN